jgi:hypothetical protein
MRTQTNAVLDRARVREVTAVFYTLDAVEAAGHDLLLAGFDRSDIDVIAPPDEVRKKLGPEFVSVPPADRADIPDVPRQPFVSREDLVTIEAVFAGLLGAVVALATALLMIWSGGSPTKIGLWAAFLGLIAAGVGIWLARHRFLWDRFKGAVLILWVRVDSDEREAQASEILIAHGGHAVHVHEIELIKTVDDLPLASLRPDPWLGNERLGQF